MTQQENNYDFGAAMADTAALGREYYPVAVNTVKISIPDAEKRLRAGLDYLVRKFSEGRKAAEWNNDNYAPVVDWMQDNRGKGLLMTGGCGLGKTLIGTYILPVLIHDVHRKIVKCVEAQRLNSEAAKIAGKHLLSIDDLGCEAILNQYGSKRMVFADIVDAAEKEGKLLIVSTNLTVAEMQEKYGIRTVDRLRGITKFVPFTGESLRRP